MKALVPIRAARRRNDHDLAGRLASTGELSDA